ncbi:hypothetical protein EPR50_G00218830 [Perca flavescens]|uniref:Uncharacterized protein n=1 Tax=Perca flavescens TaxID=8167 RepID=A0A484C9V0_PERFV|nr:hypothetical protein EPR50_G00218830 [Perca flavescens]
MSSYAVMNENWMILSWVMVQSETEKSLKPMYEGIAHRYNTAGIEKAHYQWIAAQHVRLQSVADATTGDLLNTCASRSHYNENIIIKMDLFHCLRRFLRECVSEHHPLYSSFAQFLSAAFSVVDQEDLQRLKEAYAFFGIQPANPTKAHIREHCRTRIPQPEELVKRVEGVFQHFYLATDPNGIPLFKPSMLKTWRIQRIHILRGCLSDPEVEGGILYRHGGTLQLNHVQGEGTKVPVWIPIRGTSQQEGYHFHQAQWVTGTCVSTEPFLAQGMTGVARWNYQRLVDLKQPDVHLPTVFDPALMAELNAVSERGLGHVNSPPTAQAELPQSSSSSPAKLFQFAACPPAGKPDVTPSSTPEPQTEPETRSPLSLPLLSSPSGARTGAVKTGGRVSVLDHKRWPTPMKIIMFRESAFYKSEKLRWEVERGK